jgi:single-stranded DNA-specific DHH superfamily exonuclease
VSKLESFILKHLEPKIKTARPNPFELGDMEKAVAHVIEAVKKNKNAFNMKKNGLN